MFEAIKKYAVFSGRARRKEYWLFMLLFLIVVFVSGFVDVMMGTFSEEAEVGLVSGIVTLGLLIPSLAVSVRRLHDKNLSGWWFLLALIPFFGGIALLIIFCMRGTVGENRFGDDPLANE